MDSVHSRRNLPMKPKLTFLLSLIFLFLFGGSVYGQEEVKKEYWDNGKLKSETHKNVEFVRPSVRVKTGRPKKQE
jgi:hypothetical protein